MGMGMGGTDMMTAFFDATTDPSKQMIPDLLQPEDLNVALGEPMSWEMIGLGLEEPLPPQDIIDEL
jgi:hypothetical protein